MAINTVSEAQLAANRENAQLSTGPRTEEGKARSSQNARVHGLFSKWLILEGEDAAQFDALLADLREDLDPRGAIEETLVHDIARARWRLARLARWEWTSLGAKMQEISKMLDCPVEITGTRAVRLIAEETRLLPVFHRYDNMLNRQIFRALDTLRKIQRERKEKKEAPRTEKTLDAPAQPQAAVQNEAIPDQSAQPAPAPAPPPKHVRKAKKVARPARRRGKAPPDGRKAR